MAIELGVGYVSVVPSTGSFKAELQKQLDSMGFESSFSKHGKKAGQGFGKSFGSELSSSLPGVSAIQQSLAGYQGASAKAGALAGKALGAAFTAAATAGVAALGYTLFKGFERYTALDSANQRLKNLDKTFTALGKTGIDVSKVMKDVEASVTGTPYSLSDAFTAATSAIGVGVTDIKRYMTDVADAAAFAGGDIANIGQAFTQVINQGKLDMGILQNQLANLPIQAWLQEVYGAQVNIQDAIRDGKIGIEQLQYVVEKFATGTAQTAGDTIVGAIENMQTGFARLGANILAALFGGPIEDGANGLKESVNAITARLKEVNTWVVTNKDDIRAAFQSAQDAVQKFIDVVKGVTGFLDDIGVSAGDVVIAFVAWKTISGVASLGKALGGIGTMLGITLPASAAAGASKITAALAPVAAMAATIVAAYALGKTNPVMDGPGAVMPDGSSYQVGPDGKVTINGPGTGTPPWLGGGGQFDAPSGSASSGGGEPGWGGPGATPLGAPPPLQPGKPEAGKDAPKPVLPFNQTLPAWTAGTPATEDFFGASSSWLDTRHDLEEKQAYLNQLEADNTSTAAEILDAKNEVAQKERDMHAQDLNLQSARIKAYEEFYKTGKKTEDNFESLADSLGSMVKLDEDLGISRGLVGITENVLKFLAGLAAAPIMGMLAGAQKGMEAQLPDGWLGKANSLTATTSGAGSGGMMGLLESVMPGGATAGAGGVSNSRVDAATALAQSASGSPYTYGASDLVNGLADCSGAVSDLYEVISTGQSNAGRQFSTTNFANDESAAALGFKPGYRPGALNVGVNPAPGMSGHMAATLPNGVAFESSVSGGIQYGQGAAGALDPQFPKQYYYPIDPLQRADGGNIPGSGSGDKIPVLAEPGEHMLSRDDVAKMGGQGGVYSFRNALHRQTGGPIPLVPNPDDIYSPENTNPALSDPMGAPPLPGTGTPAFEAPTQIKPAEAMPAAPDLAPKPAAPTQPAMLGSDGQPIIGPDGRPLGMDGNPMDMPSDQQAKDFDKRLAGFIPQAAKANTVPGTSNLSRIWMMGAEVANGIIDQAASAASTAASLAVAGGTMGVGAAGGSQAAAAGASFLIGLGTEAAKRGISYGAQMGGILSDSIVEQLFPFGAPGLIGFDSANNGINGLIDSKKKQGGVYDSGGILEPGGVAVNMSNRPESVLTQQQWDAMAQTGPASNGYGIKIENVHVSDVDEMSRSLSARQRLAAMQYTGRP